MIKKMTCTVYMRANDTKTEFPFRQLSFSERCLCYDPFKFDSKQSRWVSIHLLTLPADPSVWRPTAHTVLPPHHTSAQDQSKFIQTDSPLTPGIHHHQLYHVWLLVKSLNRSEHFHHHQNLFFHSWNQKSVVFVFFFRPVVSPKSACHILQVDVECLPLMMHHRWQRFH